MARKTKKESKPKTNFSRKNKRVNGRDRSRNYSKKMSRNAQKKKPYVKKKQTYKQNKTVCRWEG